MLPRFCEGIRKNAPYEKKGSGKRKFVKPQDRKTKCDCYNWGFGGLPPSGARFALEAAGATAAGQQSKLQTCRSQRCFRHSEHNKMHILKAITGLAGSLGSVRTKLDDITKDT